VLRSELQAENQAILESLEIGIISVSQNGIKYFNKVGEMILVKCIMQVKGNLKTKRECMQELGGIKDHIGKCKPHFDIGDKRKAI
jgi:hypothetical protein